MFEKSALLRIARSEDGQLAADPAGKLSGRGAYICKDPECLKKARKARAVERSLFRNQNSKQKSGRKNAARESDEDIYRQLESVLAENFSGEI